MKFILFISEPPLILPGKCLMKTVFLDGIILIIELYTRKNIAGENILCYSNKYDHGIVVKF